MFLLTLFFSQPIVFKYAMTDNKIHHKLLCDNFAVDVDTDTIGIAIAVRQEFYHDRVVDFRFDFDCVMQNVGASAAAISMVCRSYVLNSVLTKVYFRNAKIAINKYHYHRQVNKQIHS